MGRPVTLFTGQWADLPLRELAKIAADFGYDGLELACWGDHMDVDKGAESKSYCDDQLAILDKNGLKCFAISHHLAGQLVCDLNNDSRTDAFSPKETHSDADKKRTWAVETMKKTAKTAKNLGVKIVNGFTGSSIWHLLYGFPPPGVETIKEGFEYTAKMWNPILDVFDNEGIKFALEVHPTEIAYDIRTAERLLDVLKGRKTLGFNFDPSHLHWQMMDPVKFIQKFPDRIYHCHVKDAVITLDGESSILASHLNFGDPGRGWDFRSPGRGEVDFENIIRALNQIAYNGPLSVEWEDNGMDRMHGAKEACEFVRELDFEPSDISFDSQFDE